MKYSNIYSLGLGILILGLVPTPAMGITIDLFTDTQSIGSTTATSGTFSDDSITGSSSIFGGDRTLSTTISNGSGNPVTFNGISVFSGSGTITAESGATVGGTFLWDGFTSGGSGDLTFIDGSKIADSIILSVTNVSETVNMQFTVKDIDGTEGTLTKEIIDEEIGKYYYSFDNFSASGGTTSGINFEKINYIEMSTVGTIPANLDLTFNLVESGEIPFEFSPSLGIILCSSFFGICKLRKRFQYN